MARFVNCISWIEVIFLGELWRNENGVRERGKKEIRGPTGEEVV
jgi:hypothetical protein